MVGWEGMAGWATGSSRHSEKGRGSGYILRVELVGFVDGLDVEE